MSTPPERPPRHPPRILSKAEAAAYCRLSEKDFDGLVRPKTLPPPLAAGRGWDIVAIDHAIDRISGVSRFVPPPSARTTWFDERRERKAAEAARHAEVDRTSLNPQRRRTGSRGG